MAVLVFLSASARARVIAAYGLVDLDRSVGLLLGVGGEVAAARLHPAHVSARLDGTLRTLLCGLAERHECLEKE